MNLFKSFSSIFLFVQIINTILKTTEAKILLKIYIYNYKNEDNIKSDGNYCEAFNWLNDHCDPQFHICISEKNQCDILNKNIKATDNAKIIYNVLSQIIQLDHFIKTFSISVKVDDVDGHGINDHIAKFLSKFTISKSGENFQTNMMVIPKNLKVGLQVKVSISCAQNYQGETCNQRTDKIQCLSSCKNGRCYLIEVNDTFVCDEKIISLPFISTTKMFPLSTKFSEYSNEKYRTQSLDLTTKVIIICLLLLLSICVISLAFVVKSWHRKNVRNNLFNPNTRPLPPIIYQKNQGTNKSAEMSLKKPEELQWQDDSPYEACIIKTNHTYCDNNLIQFDNSSNNIENPYEIPLIQNIEKASSSDDEVYEKPIKFNKY